MKSRRSLPIAILLALAGCSNRAAPVTSEPIDSNAARKAIELYDANKDGFLDEKELQSAPGLKSASKQLDKSGKITEAEIAARIESWRRTGAGRLGIACKVTRKGKPVAGAQVNFVPEPFLGAGLQGGGGVTNPQGIANINGTSGLPGMSSGFYRVEITKAGEDVPAKYNRETELGEEVSIDAGGVGGDIGSITFNLQY